MSLLQDIQNKLVDQKSDISDILRMCKILSFRLHHELFKEWVDNELNGYKSKDKLPNYRIISVQSIGHFNGPFGSGIRNGIIPPICIPEAYRELITHCYLHEPISSYSALVNRSNKNNPKENWPADLVALVGDDIMDGMVCVSAWKQIPVNTLEALIDTVKTRILNFCLEIESVNPLAGEPDSNSDPISQDKVTQVFNTYITGDVQNISNGSTDVKQNAVINNGLSDKLFIDLLEKINSSEVDESIKKRFEQIIKEMESHKGKKSFNEKYNTFISLLSDHMQVIGTLIAPFLPQITALLLK